MSRLIAFAGAVGLIVGTLGCGDDTVKKQPPSLIFSTESVSVTEGGSMTFTVALSESLELDGAVTLTVADGGVATVSPQVVTFTAGDTAAKTVTVTGSQDTNLANATTSITVSAAGVNAGTVAVAVTDDDVQGLVASTTAVSMTEGGTATFGVHLAFEPAADETVTLTAADTARLGAAPAALTFTATNYGADQTVTLTAAEDVDVAVNTVVTTISSGTLTPVTVTATIGDNDVQTVSPSVGAVMLTEADAPTSGTFTVVLTQQPAADVTVNLASSDVGAATVSPATLTFTPADYANGAAHTVTVTPVSDNNVADETLSLTLTSAGLTTVTLPVTVDDDDVQAIVATSPVNVAEGGTAAMGVHLAFDPGSQITVAVASSDPGAATASPTTLTFDSASFATDQDVTISGEQDDDLAAETTAMMLTSAGVATLTVPVNVSDDDTQEIQLTYPGSPGTLTLPEGTSTVASTQIVGVRLAFRPAAPVTLTIGSNNADLATSTTTLTFTQLTFATPQNVTLTALDELDVVDESATVTFTDGTLTETINVDIPDTDVQGFAVTPGTLPVIGEGSSTTFNVQLNFAPAAAVTASITSNNPKVKVNNGATATVVIPAGNTAQSITVSVDQDADAADELATLTIHDIAAGFPDRLLSASGDDDETMTFVLTPMTLDVDGSRLDVIEQGADVTFAVRLTAAPTANTTVTLTPSTTNVVQVSNNGTTFGATTTVAFTPGDFANRTITVRGLTDPNLIDELFNITVAGPTQLGAPDAFVYMRKIEDDAQAILTTPIAPGPLTVTEGAAPLASPISVRLQFQPATTVQIMIAPSAATILLNGTTTTQTLLFTTSNYDQPQTVFVTTPQDPDQDNPAAGTITVSSPALLSRVIAVNLVDEDDQTIILSKPSTTLQETPALPDTDTFTVRLGYIPTASPETITIAVPSPGPAAFGGLPNKVDVCDGMGSACGPIQQLTFTAANYDQPQTVLVRSNSDIDVANETVPLALTSDRSPNPTNTFIVNVVDDDQLNVVIQPGQVATIHETPLVPTDAISTTFTMSLNFDPTTPVTVALTSADTGAVTVSTPTLTFDSSNWFAPQSFTVTRVIDADVRNELVNVAVTSARTPATAVAITVLDHDQQGLVFAGGLQINEGSNTTLQVKLAHQPSANVTVAVSTSISAISGLAAQTITATPTLTFTPADWNVDHPVTVASPEDADLDHFDGKVSLAVTSGQTGQELASADSASYDVRDNDSQSIVVSRDPAGLINSAQEGGPTVQFKVRLTHRPRLGVQDTVNLVAPGLVRFGNSMTLNVAFTAADFATEQTVVWRMEDGGNMPGNDFTADIALALDESADQAAPFGAANVSPTAVQSVRGIDNDVPVLDGLDVLTLNGATQFVQRSNVAFGFDGTAEGILAVTGRSLATGGNASIGFSTRGLGSLAVGPDTATGGLEPTTEIIEFDADADGAGADVAAWNVFTSDATGIVFTRISITGTVLVAKTVVAPAADNATDFSVARNADVYGVAYRRESVSRNNLYFRSVTLAGAVSAEQVTTTADTFVHFHPTLMFVGDGPVTTYDSGTGPVAAPYIVIYASNGFTKLVRMTATGGPLAAFTFDSSFPGDFSSSLFMPDGLSGATVLSAAVHSVGPALGDNRVFIHGISLNPSGAAAFHLGRVQMTNSQMSAVSPPSLAFNGADVAVAFDDGLGGVNSVGVALLSMNFNVREFRLSDVADAGVFPSIAWALDRWVIRYQADSPTSTGIRIRSGSFDGQSTPN